MNVRDNGGFTPLHYACSEGWGECVTLLLETPGVDMSMYTNIHITHNTRTTTHRFQHYLLTQHKDATTEDFACYIAASIPMYMTGGRTPLHYAVDKGEVQCAELLIVYGVRNYFFLYPYALDSLFVYSTFYFSSLLLTYASCVCLLGR